jgi:DNA-binding HxlR family transcriptional regulator
MWRCKDCRPVPEEIRRAADILERRWTVSILYASYEGCTRFNEFRQAVGGISPRILAQRLTELEQAGVVRREVQSTRPPLVQYVLTDDGRSLKAVVDALARWATA